MLAVVEMAEIVEVVGIVLLQILYQTLSAVGLFRIVGHQAKRIQTVQIMAFVVLMDVLIPVSTMHQSVIRNYHMLYRNIILPNLNTQNTISDTFHILL